MVARSQDELSNSSFHKIDFKNLEPSLQQVVKRKVRFASQDSVRQIPHINDLSDEEIDDVWMHPDDFRTIRRECQAIILFIDSGNDLPEDIELRGLEHHISKQKEHVQAVQRLLYETADKIQDFGDESSLDVSDVLASMCNKISCRYEEQAREIALQDELEAKAS